MPYPSRRGAGPQGPAGEDGNGIASSSIAYQVSSSPTSPPTQWESTIPPVQDGSYLWTRVSILYTNNTSSVAYSVAYSGLDGASGINGKDGVNGRGIASSVVTYQTSASGTETPTGAWLSTMSVVGKGQYLWVRTTINYTDNTSSAAYSVSYFGNDGAPGKDGVNGSNGSNGTGVASSTVTYQAGSSGSTAPTGTWASSVPSVTKGQYLWTRAVVSYTDGTSTTVYSVGYQGLDGSQGQAGVSYNPQSPSARTVTVSTPYQHSDTTKPYRCVVNVRATQTLTVAGLSADKLELRAGPNQAAVAAGGSGGFSLAVWESGITGIALMVGAGIQDGGQMICDIPAGWYFQVNRLSGTSATVVSCFTQSMTA